MKMKIARAIAAAGVAATALGFGGSAQIASAQTPVTNLTYTTGLKIQNLSSSNPATVTLNFYAEGSSSVAATATENIAANGSVTTGLPTTLAPGFKGAAILSSDQPIAAVINIASPNAAATFAGGSYVGFTSGSRSVAIPLAFKKFFTFSTFFSVQNIGDSPTNVSITYRGVANGNAVNSTQTATIQPNSSVTFNQETDTNITPALPDGFNGAATITSDTEDIVAAVMQVSSSSILGYGGFAASAKRPVMPTVQANNFGFFTGLNIQNRGGTATDVTVTYTPGTNAQGQATGTTCTETITIAPGDKQAFAQNAFAAGGRGTAPGTDNCANGALFIGSAAVTANSADVDLVAAVNQLNLGTNKGDTYGGFDPAQGTNAVVFPTIQDRFFEYFTGINIVNVGTVETPVNCTYTNSTVTDSRTLKAGEVVNFGSLNKFGAGNYNGSATCVATAAGAKIVGVANQLRNVAGVNTDQFFVYEGINVTR